MQLPSAILRATLLQAPSLPLVARPPPACS
ncbi:MAG: hypothetical protein OSP8Acid_02120 [uncultured Acidilobus sp. OSP8]|nr:MAG: hypothetical protein OSP8Acid_02120 [uncultured Acidilobus sp. OSP8]